MVMDIKKIMETIPHRQPFLLIDRIEELEPGKRAVGKKCVSYNEPFFNGHFPQETGNAGCSDPGSTGTDWCSGHLKPAGKQRKDRLLWRHR